MDSLGGFRESPANDLGESIVKRSGVSNSRGQTNRLFIWNSHSLFQDLFSKVIIECGANIASFNLIPERPSTGQFHPGDLHDR